MFRWLPLLLGSLVACTPPLQVDLGDERELSRPNGGLHHHATVAWVGNRAAVAWTAGFEPQTGAWFRLFGARGGADAPPSQLNSNLEVADKPDVATYDGGLLTAFDDRSGGVWVRDLTVEGRPLGPELLLQDSVGFEVDAVDLALQPDGSGIAIWTESGAEWMQPDDGRIVYRRFGAGLKPEGPPRIVESSSKKTSDAAPLDDGGFVAVWAKHHDHPTTPDEVLYEVHGRFYFADGSTHSFRADDLDDAWPSRPAVAVSPVDGRLAVSWRDKTSSRGDHAGAYGRVFGADGTPIASSVALGPGGDGNRVVTAWAGEHALFAWEETGPDGLAAVWMSALDGATGEVLVDRLEISEPGGLRDARPAVDVRETADGHEVLVVWETLRPGNDVGEGLRMRSVLLLH